MFWGNVDGGKVTVCDGVGVFECLSFQSCRFEFATKRVNHFYVASDAGYN